MSAPVDVLAVLGRTARFFTERMATDRAAELVRARAAVTELIEATHRFRAALAVVVMYSEQSATEAMQDAAAKSYERAADRLDAALAGVRA